MSDRIDGENQAYFRAISGRKVHVFAPQPHEFALSDIAWALADRRRHNGHIWLRVSVAEHSVLMARFARDEHGSEDLAAACLAHDFSDAYLPDVPRPIKLGLPGFDACERDLQAAIYAAFGIEAGAVVARDVARIDARMLLTEVAYCGTGARLDEDFGPMLAAGLRPLPAAYVPEGWPLERACGELIAEAARLGLPPVGRARP